MVATKRVTKTQQVTPFERLEKVLDLIDREPAKPIDNPDQVKFGKAVGLLGGGSVYINRSNADVRSTPKTVSEWVKAGLGTARGDHSQYLRISF